MTARMDHLSAFRNFKDVKITLLMPSSGVPLCLTWLLLILPSWFALEVLTVSALLLILQLQAWIVLFRNTSMKFLLFCSAVLETPEVMSILRALSNYRKF